MNKLLMTAAAVMLATSTASFAQMDTHDANAVEYMLRSYDVTYDGNLADLTAEQKAALAAVDTSADLPDNQVQAQIMSALGDGASLSEDGTGGASDMRDVVIRFSNEDEGFAGGTDQLLLDRYGFDVDYNDLTAQQKAALAAVSVDPSSSRSMIRAQIESALNS